MYSMEQKQEIILKKNNKKKDRYKRKQAKKYLGM